jgi:hypothetical protein
MWKPRLSFRGNRTSASAAVFILEDCLAEEIQKGHKLKWDLGLPCFRRAVRNGDESASEALHHAVEDALQRLSDALGGAELYSGPMERLDFESITGFRGFFLLGGRRH